MKNLELLTFNEKMENLFNSQSFYKYLYLDNHSNKVLPCVTDLFSNHPDYFTLLKTK